MIQIAIIEDMGSVVDGMIMLWVLGCAAIVPLLICLAFRRTRRVAAWILTADMFGLCGICLALAIEPPKQRPQREFCRNQLKQIGVACRMYSMDHRERFPPSFLSLTNYVDQPKLFVCPLSKHKPGSIERVDSWTDYVLVTGLTEASDSDLVLAYCKHTTHRTEKGANVLYVDGSVIWVKCDDFGAIPCDLARHSRMNRRPQQNAAPLPSAPWPGPSEGAR
jgi:prepilin-type processing-associated H-X9-DG protein